MVKSFGMFLVSSRVSVYVGYLPNFPPNQFRIPIFFQLLFRFLHFLPHKTLFTFLLNYKKKYDGPSMRKNESTQNISPVWVTGILRKPPSKHIMNLNPSPVVSFRNICKISFNLNHVQHHLEISKTVSVSVNQ